MADTARDGRATFDRILNFRDVGQYINDTTSKNLLKPGLLYRSARPDSATPSDAQKLQQTFKIKTIIDLRTPTEHAEATTKYHASTTSGKKTSFPFRMPGIDYRDVNFNGSGYSNALIKQLTYAHRAKLYGLYVFGYRKEAISVLGTNVMAERGLSGLAIDSLEHCKAEVKEVFDVLCDETSYPVLVHCTQGKDRTGLIVLLVLMLVGIERESIKRDYVLSESELEPEREDKLEEIRSIGLPDSFADCPKDWVGIVSGHIERECGGVEKYLESCGVSAHQQQELKDILMVG